ncbi:DUF6210 family protein [Streptomyces sp. NPDC101234]|uniref:DUF6210 family protein n=1 Tax=Streptomyces sp. NPDC101234 TaxID=3366138 RepID=UPI00381B9049
MAEADDNRRYISLDPDGTGSGRGWMFVVVAAFHLYGSANQDDLYPARLALDETRLADVDEAWVPVVTPDGPGVLVWENSD